MSQGSTTRRWPWRQSWCDLAFLHWQVDAEAVKRWIPDPLKVRRWEGETWVGLVPFQMDDIGWFGLPGVPGHTTFPEINVRLYVEYEGQPGVWFVSLEAPRALAVWVARTAFDLPYYRSSIRFCPNDDEGWTRVESTRKSHLQGQVPPRLQVRYRPTSEPFVAQPGSLEEWLTDLDRLYTVGSQGTVSEARVDHPPWPLQQAEVVVENNSLVDSLDLGIAPLDPAHCLFSRRVAVRMTSRHPVEGVG